MAGVADEQHGAPALPVDFGLAMHFGDQRAGGVDGEEVALLRLGGDGFGDAMGGEDHRRLRVRNLAQLLDENRALGLQRLDDIAIVHDLVAHIDGRPEFGEGALDGVDGAHHPGAEAARRAQQDFQRGLRPAGLDVHGLRFSIKGPLQHGGRGRRRRCVAFLMSRAREGVKPAGSAIGVPPSLADLREIG